MTDRYLLRFAAPLAIVSILLMGLGAAAAWTIHRQQTVAAELLGREMEGMLTTGQFYSHLRSARISIHKFARQADATLVQEIEMHRRQAERTLVRTRALAVDDRQLSLISEIERQHEAFWSEYDRIQQTDFAGDRTNALNDLISLESTSDVFAAIERYIDASRHFAAFRHGSNQEISNQIRWAFLLLGICGGAGGLLGGVALARALRRSIVQLEISVRNTQGKLVPIAGPVRITRTGGLKDLESGLERIESQISGLVERVQRSENELLRSEQLAAVGQLAAGIAHEFRNPLMPMKMLVQAALERNDGRGLCGRQLEVVEEEIRRLERSIQVFLEFARPVSPQMSSFDLAEAIRQTLELVATRSRQQGVQLDCDLPDEPLLMVADVAQIRQVLLNVFLNALDAMPTGGTAALTVRRLAPDDVIEAARHIAWCEICIRDSGPGLADQVLSRIFEPFVTSKETGTGLGLSICQRIVAAHGGEITARNLPEQGAEFTIQLPCLPPAPVPADTQPLLSSTS